jgi:hypothetical protein
MRERHHQIARYQPTDHARRHVARGQNVAAHDRTGDIGLEHVPGTELGHEHNQVFRSSAQPADGFGQRQSQPAIVGELPPVVAAPAEVARLDAAKAVKRVVVGDETLHAVAHHRLLFGEVHVHYLRLTVRMRSWR